MTQKKRERWEEWILQCWGPDGGEIECANLRELWDALPGPLPEVHQILLWFIGQLSVCNWNLEQQLEALCRSIGSDQLPDVRIGHRDSITKERWEKVWAYYLAIRSWLPFGERSGYPWLLGICDPEGEVKKHVDQMLGERTELKELYVERFCLALEWCGVGGLYPSVSRTPREQNQKPAAQGIAHAAAVTAVEDEIKKRDPGSDILPWIENDGKGQLEPCHHKAFRRYDIIISSIGSGQWRGSIPERKTDGFDRGKMLDPFIIALGTWLAGKPAPDKIAQNAHEDLGDREDTKIFLVAFLHSYLRAFQRNTRQIAENRTKTM